MRFFSVADAAAARRSVLYATGFIGYFYALTLITGFGAIALLPSSSPLVGGTSAALASNERVSNIVAIQLSYAVGGGLFLSFFAAAGQPRCRSSRGAAWLGPPSLVTPTSWRPVHSVSRS
jgi:cation/acetate symporter